MPHIRTRYMTLMLALVLGESVSVLAQEARQAGDVRRRSATVASRHRRGDSVLRPRRDAHTLPSGAPAK